MASIAELLDKDLEASYRKIIDFGDAKPSPKGEVAVCCPVHDDTKGSLRINVKNGKWNCFGCSDDDDTKSGGTSPISLFCFMHETDWADACQELEAIFGYRKTPKYDVFKQHKDLLGHQNALTSLYNRGLDLDTLKRYQIGLKDNRVCLPEFDLGGTLRQVIMHDTMKVFGEEYKSLSLVSGLGVRLWPLENLRKKNIVYIFEGWLDALLAIRHGLNAVSITGSGANAWNDKFNKYFNGKQVYICYDADAPGEKASEKLANKISSVASKVYRITLTGDKLPEKADFTDYIKCYGIDRFKSIPVKEWVYTGGKEELLQNIPLGESNRAEYYNKKIETTAVVTGTSLLFQLPKTIQAQCTPGTCGEICSGCMMQMYNGMLTTGINPQDKDLLNFVRATDQAIDAVIKTKKLGIPKKCYAANIEVTQVQNLEELVIVSSIDFNEYSSGYDRRAAFAVTDNKFEAGRPYVMKAINVPDPKTQASSLLVYDAKPTTDNIDSFQMCPDILEQLKVFQANGMEEMKKVRDRKYHDYEKVTQINGRTPLFFGMELVAFSGLAFNFRKRFIKRGYVNALFYGDTRTGKSESAEKLMAYWRAGDSTSGENLSFAGLIGGLHQINGKNWTIDWGLMPLNDRRLLKIDEFHGMKEGEFARTSETISSGVATIHKIGKERAMARCRLMIISNTKDNEHMSSYRYPCEAVPPIMGGAPEDIARLDFALGVCKEDVTQEVINKKPAETDFIFTSDHFHNLIMWAWSRTPEHIFFTPEAEESVMDHADKLIKHYHQKIPLIIQGEQTVKLARLAVSCAIMYFSTDHTGEKVIVRPEHVEMVFNFLNHIYASNGSKYYQYSKFLKSREELRNLEDLETIPFTDTIKSQMLATKYIRGKNITQWFVHNNPSETNAVLNTLEQCNAFEPYHNNQFRKTQAFVKWLNERDFGDQNYQALVSQLGF